MIVSHRTAAGVVAGVLLLGVAIGRFGLPAKTIERDRIVTSDREVESRWHAYVGHAESKVETKTRWQVVTKWEKDGSVSQTQVAVQDRVEATKTDVVQQDVAIKERIVEKIVDRERIVEAKKPDWLLGAKIGVDTAKRDLIYQGEVNRRVFGPVFVNAWGQRAPAGWTAGFGVTLLF